MAILINGDNLATAGGIAYGSGGTTLAFNAAGTVGQVLLSNGTSAPTWGSTPAASALSGGVAGAIPYQSAPSTTGFSAAGTSGQVLTSAGTSVPTWTTATNANTASAIVQRDASGNFSAGTITASLNGNASTASTATSATTASTATSATTAVNLAGGAAGSVPYNSSAGATTFLALGTTNYVLTAGASAPQYVAQSSLAVGSATNIAGGGAGQFLYNTASGTTAFLAVGSANQVLTSNGTGTPTWTSAGDANTNIGYLNIPQNSQSASYTLVIGDSGKSIYHPSADTSARTWTIPANSSVAFPIGTAVTFINDTSAGTITISITSDTLVLAGTGTTGSRTLAANGMATAIKMTSTRWMISGSGLT
jgi:hypothetical protein